MAYPLSNWLHSDEDPGVGFATTPRRAASPESFLKASTEIFSDKRKSYLSRSSSNSSSSDNSSSSVTGPLSRKSSASTVPSTAPTLNAQQPWHVHVANLPHIPTIPVSAGNPLPCEFLFTGCEVSFPSNNHEHWILHSLSHFPNSTPPEKCVCTICDAGDAIFDTNGSRQPSSSSINDRVLNWRVRMHHVADHFEFEGKRYEDMRPDFFVIKHLAGHQDLLSEADFKLAMSYTERPELISYTGEPSSGLNLVPFGFKPPEMRARERRSHAQVHDIRREDRQRRRQR